MDPITNWRLGPRQETEAEFNERVSRIADRLTKGLTRMVRAKFTVTQVRQHYYNNGKEAMKGGTEILLSPQYDDSIPEDQRFARATPSGEMRLVIDNPAAVDYLKPGEAFYVDFTAVADASASA